MFSRVPHHTWAKVACTSLTPASVFQLNTPSSWCNHATAHDRQCNNTLSQGKLRPISTRTLAVALGSLLPPVQTPALSAPSRARHRPTLGTQGLLGDRGSRVKRPPVHLILPGNRTQDRARYHCATGYPSTRLKHTPNIASKPSLQCICISTVHPFNHYFINLIYPQLLKFYSLRAIHLSSSLSENHQ